MERNKERKKEIKKADLENEGKNKTNHNGIKMKMIKITKI